MKGTRSVFLLLLVGTAVQAGCTVIKPSVRKPSDGLEIPHFRYEKEELEPRVHWVKEKKTYRIEKISFPSSMTPYQVTGYLYDPKAKVTPPTIIIIPILGGNYFFSKNCANYLTQRGFSCLRFERTTDPFDVEKGLHHTERVLWHSVIDFRRVIDWLVEGKGRNPNRIGVMGVSMGAIVAALALAVEPRIAPGAIILGGGDIATILATSKERRVVRFREGVVRAKGMTLEQFHEEASRVMAPVDPLAYATRADPKSILMVNGRFDRTIPYDCSEKLWQAMGRPLWITIPTGHYSAVLFLWHIRHQILIHFRKWFGVEGWSGIHP